MMMEECPKSHAPNSAAVEGGEVSGCESMCWEVRDAFAKGNFAQRRKGAKQNRKDKRPELFTLYLALRVKQMVRLRVNIQFKPVRHFELVVDM